MFARNGESADFAAEKREILRENLAGVAGSLTHMISNLPKAQVNADSLTD